MAQTFKSKSTHKLGVRVYFEDTDACGIVYYANYLRYAERARTEMLRGVGLSSSDLIKDYGFVLAVRSCNINYLRSARLDDELTVTTELKKIGGASIEINQSIMKSKEILVTIDLKLGCLNLSNSKAVRLPENMQDILKQNIITAQ